MPMTKNRIEQDGERDDHCVAAASLDWMLSEPRAEP
jgi:hypothetical protein